MLSWQWPYLFALIPLPLLIRWLSPSLEMATGAIKVPFYELLQGLDQSKTGALSSGSFRALLIWLVWLCLVTATARPMWVGEPVLLPQERRDLMLAVDISGSMREEDMLINQRYINRITAVKAVIGDFVKQRTGDRMGLILFGQQGYLQTPLTYDTQTVNQQLQEAQIGFAGNATAIGDAVGLAIKRLKDRPADSRVLILLTDGANSAGTDPMEAASVAAEAGIRIHTVGVGADSKMVRDFFGRSRSTNPAAELDTDTLTKIADLTGGQFFRAQDPAELRTIYTELDQLEPIPEDQTFRPTRSLAHWLILAALLISGLLMLLSRRN